MDGRTDKQMDGYKEIHPCNLQDNGPLGPLPKKEEGKGRKEEKKEKLVIHGSHMVCGTRCPAPSDQVGPLPKKEIREKEKNDRKNKQTNK